MFQRRSILGLFIFVVWLTGSVVIAQTQRGAIEGLVTDPSGAVVPGAKLEVTNPLTGVKTEATTNDRGLYSLPFLTYGRYNMTVMAAGFEQFLASGIEVASSTTTTYNVSLAMGKAAQQIQVTASPIVLEGNTSDVGTSMDQKLVQDLPLVMNSDPVRSGFGLRSPFQLAWLVPTLDTNGYMEIAGSVNPFRQEALMDGLSLDNNSQYYGGHYPPTDPSIEIIGEFKAELN